MEILAVIMLIQVIAIHPTYQYCSKYRRQDQRHIQLKESQRRVEYTSKGNDDYCQWRLPDIDHDVVLFYVRAINMYNPDGHCAGYIAFSDNRMAWWCDQSYVGCYFYTRNSSKCKPENILHQVSEQHPEISCEKYSWVTADSLPSQVFITTSTNGGYQYEKSFSLEYRQMQCRQPETTTTITYTEATVKPATGSSVATTIMAEERIEVTSPESDNLSGLIPWIAVVAVMAILLLASWIFFIIRLKKHKKQWERETSNNFANSVHVRETIENEIYHQHDQGQESEYQEATFNQVEGYGAGGVQRYAVGDAQDVYTMAG